MKTVLIASGSGWHVRDLLRAASCLDLEVEVVSFLELEARLGVGDQNSPSSPSGIRARGLELGQADRVLVRTMPAGSLEQIVFRMDALHWLQSAGVPVFNSTRALETAIDKYLSLSRLAAAGLPVPATVTCEHAQSALEAFDTLGGDVVTKPLFGSEGRDLLRIERRCDAEDHFRNLEAADSIIYQQQFIDHPGRDIRVLVLGDTVAGAMERRVDHGWVTNVAQGGRAQPTSLSRTAEVLALRAARAVGAEIAGVDLLPDKAGKLWVLEVNAVPGWRALGKVCGRDFAADILRHVVQHPNG